MKENAQLRVEAVTPGPVGYASPLEAMKGALGSTRGQQAKELNPRIEGKVIRRWVWGGDALTLAFTDGTGLHFSAPQDGLITWGLVEAGAPELDLDDYAPPYVGTLRLEHASNAGEEDRTEEWRPARDAARLEGGTVLFLSADQGAMTCLDIRVNGQALEAWLDVLRVVETGELLLHCFIDDNTGPA